MTKAAVPKGAGRVAAESLDIFAQFIREHEKIGDDSPPPMPETPTRLIKDLPRDDEVVELCEKLFRAGPCRLVPEAG